MRPVDRAVARIDDQDVVARGRGVAGAAFLP